MISQEGYGQSTPLTYYYGYASPGDNSKLYMQLSTTLASRVDGRLDRDADARASGLIINTCGWIDATGYDVLLHCIEAFAIDVILVMGHDKLFSKITADAAEHISVVKLPKSGGVVERVRFYVTSFISSWFSILSQTLDHRCCPSFPSCPITHTYLVRTLRLAANTESQGYENTFMDVHD